MIPTSVSYYILNQIIIKANCKNDCKVSSISCTKSEHLNVSHLVLQLSFPNPLKPGVKSRMKM